MFRPNALLNAASKAASFRVIAPRMAPIATRFYSAGHGDIESRVLDVLRGFDKVDPNKVGNNKEKMEGESRNG